jgi:preprotein translocase subunit SecE
VAEKEEKVKQPNRVQKYFRETIGELRKVSWPTPQEAWSLTKIVLIVLAVMSMALGLLDFLFSWIVTKLVA